MVWSGFSACVLLRKVARAFVVLLMLKQVLRPSVCEKTENDLPKKFTTEVRSDSRAAGPPSPVFVHHEALGNERSGLSFHWAFGQGTSSQLSLLHQGLVKTSCFHLPRDGKQS